MNNFKPKDLPNTPHPAFPFDEDDNSPVGGGIINLGGKWPEASEYPDDSHWADWADACERIRILLEAYNAALLYYKKNDPEGKKPDGSYAKAYRDQAKL